MSNFLRHTNCSQCKSSDALAIYDDGKHCFSCGYHTNDVDEQKDETVNPEIKEGFAYGQIVELTKRKISYETCLKYNYQVGTIGDKPVQIANYIKDGTIQFQKLRYPDKEFVIIGDSREGVLFGNHIQGKGRRIVVTEGEIDAMSVYEAFGRRWPVVSVKNGAQGASKSIKENLSYLKNFEEIVLLFDNDEPGQEAAQECVRLLPPGKGFIATLPLKDANDMLVAGREAEIVQAVYGAQPFRPDGILTDDELLIAMTQEKKLSDFKYPYPIINELTYGLHAGEITLICGGTGLGKSTFTRELAYNFIKQKKKVGFLILEEAAKFVGESLLSIHLSKQLRFDLNWNKNSSYIQTFKEEIMPYMAIFNDQGSLDCKHLVNVIEYMTLVKDCKVIILDHISMAALPDEGKGDERLAIDLNMTNLRRLAQRLDIAIVVVSHLRKTSNGKSFERGAQVDSDDLRGSGTLKTIPNTVISFEGDLFDPLKERRLRVLKCRFTGKVGDADRLTYDEFTGRMSEINSI